MTAPDPWTDRRRHAATEHAAAHRRERAVDGERARSVVADFVQAAIRLGIAPAPLRARGYDGRSTYRTRLRGWALHTDGRMAVGTDGEFYLLTVPTSWWAHVVGVHLEPHDPPLQIGRGAGDGESIALSELLDRRLAGNA
ncbi:MAG: hypothetical protein ABI912_00030 [Actinomycetota bacterium]